MQSFFEREPGVPCERGRILLVSYHFPPAQTAGALRWRKLARFAFERGWGLDVLCLDPGTLELRNDESLADLPNGIRLFGVSDSPLWIERLEERMFRAYRRIRSGPPSHRARTSTDGKNSSPAQAIERAGSLARGEESLLLRSPRTWARAYWAAIDFARGRKWARRAAALGDQIIDRDSHRLIVSCGPPHMAHEAARRLSRDLGLPMVMDLRDAWSLCERTPETLASPLYFGLARHYEGRAVRAASLVTMNTQPACEAMQRLYPLAADRIESVPNAHDDRPIPKLDRDPRFLIAYAGTVYLDRTPRTLFEAAALFVRESSLEAKDFAVEFMGHIGDANGKSIEDMADDAHLSAYVRTHPPAEYAIAERFMASAAVLVSLPQDSDLAIPSKIFDYMRFEARLLVLAEPGSATAQHLLGSRADVVAPDDVEAVLDVLRDAYRQYLAGERIPPIARDPRYSRRRSAERLFEAIDRVLDARSSE